MHPAYTRNPVHVFWSIIIRPILEILQPKTILEIGTSKGDTTRELLKFCAETDAMLHGIDTKKSPEMEELQTLHPDSFTFHQDLSLNVLGNIPPCDAILIDGDHNWYTVYHELMAIQRLAEATGTFPLVFIHNTEWPYGRRDKYSDPARIPEQFRQPYARGGFSLDDGMPKENTGFRHRSFHALHENGERNGVRTAVDDFLKQTSIALTYYNVPGFFGLGVLVPDVLIRDNEPLRKFLTQLQPNPVQETYMRQLERDRTRELTDYEQLSNAHLELQKKIVVHQQQIQKELKQARIQTVKTEEKFSTLREQFTVVKNKNEEQFSALKKKHEETMAAQKEEAAIQNRHRQMQLEQQQQMQQDLKQARIRIIKAENDLQRVYATKSWRWTAWLRKIAPRTNAGRKSAVAYAFFGKLKGAWLKMGMPFPRLTRYIRHELCGGFWPARENAAAKKSNNTAYESQLFSPGTHVPIRQREASVQRAKNIPHAPLINVIVNSERFDEILLRRALNSITEQTYAPWNVIVTAGPTDRRAIEIIVDDFNQHYPQRFRLMSSEENGKDMRNDAVRTCAGLYVCFLRSTDTLQPDALELMMSAGMDAAQWPDLIYGDHDELPDVKSTEYVPYFKPEWSPELLLSYNYIGTTFLMKREVLLSMLNPASFRGASYAYDLLLRLQSIDPTVVRTPHIVYHHHRPLRPAIEDINEERHALQAELIRRKLPHKVQHPFASSQSGKIFFRIRYEWPQHDEPKVAIIIPTKDKVDMLDQCLKAIGQYTSYPRYELIIIDSNSQEQATKDYLAKLPHTVLRIETDPFNFSYINNRAVEKTDAELILLLNDDALPHNHGWLHEMVSVMTLDKQIGVVGAKLLYPPGQPYAVQSMGMVVGRHWASLIKFRTRDELGYGAYNHVMRNCAAIGGACLLTRRELFVREGGLDEEALGVDFSDVDYCLRLMQKGYRTVVTPHAEVLHHESFTRGNNDGKGASVDEREYKAFERKWGHMFGRDPYYHPRFSLRLHDEAFTVKPETR